MNARTHHTDPRNVPVYPGAMTPAELTRRKVRHIIQAAEAVALTLATILYIAIILTH